jgi:hypothetical protein
VLRTPYRLSTGSNPIFYKNQPGLPAWLVPLVSSVLLFRQLRLVSGAPPVGQGGGSRIVFLTTGFQPEQSGWPPMAVIIRLLWDYLAQFFS